MEFPSHASALDRLIGTSPHLAMSTDFGVICPACSDPDKPYFHPALKCELAIRSNTRTEEHPWAEAMRISGLRPLSSADRSKAIGAMKTAYLRATSTSSATD